MSETLIGYARCSTDAQDLTAQRARLSELGVPEQRIYLDHGLTGTNRNRPGLDQALAAIRAGDTLVVPKLDLPAQRQLDPASGDDLADPIGKMFFNILATFAEFEVDLLRMRTREGMTERPGWEKIPPLSGAASGRGLHRHRSVIAFRP